jgi:uncharacterized membrane protein
MPMGSTNKQMQRPPPRATADEGGSARTRTGRTTDSVDGGGGSTPSLSWNTRVGIAYGFFAVLALVGLGAAYSTAGDQDAPLTAVPDVDGGGILVLVVVAYAVYLTIDALYQVTVERRLCAALFRRAGHVQTLQRTYLLFVWLLLAAATNVVFAVVPALETGRYRPRVAAFNGALLGLYGYGTLGLASAWSYDTFPIACAAVYACSGIVFNAVTGVVTGYVAVGLYHRN